MLAVDEVLRDGTVVHVRPISRDDVGGVARFHGRLSSQTTYYRFFSVHPVLSARELEYFTGVDHERREALVAVVDDEIVAVARFDRQADAGEAEVAFVVEDRWQGRGLGTMLLDRLMTLAVERGITTFVAQTLPTNRRMLAVFRHCGRPVEDRFDGDVVQVVIPLIPAEPGLLLA
jgi:RimJ/RimL family protein N-acetyltransferase